MKCLFIIIAILALPISVTWAGDWEVYHFEVLPNSDTIRYVFVKYVYDTMLIRFQDLPADTLGQFIDPEFNSPVSDTACDATSIISGELAGGNLHIGSPYFPMPVDANGKMLQISPLVSCCDTTWVLDHYEPDSWVLRNDSIVESYDYKAIYKRHIDCWPCEYPDWRKYLKR